MYIYIYVYIYIQDHPDQFHGEICIYIYANFTMKSIRVVLNRCFKETRKIDIANNFNFVHMNQMFLGFFQNQQGQWTRHCNTQEANY